jgi:hypothetical protein
MHALLTAVLISKSQEPLLTCGLLTLRLLTQAFLEILAWFEAEKDRREFAFEADVVDAFDFVGE